MLDIEYSLILTTYKHPNEAGIVLREINATTQGLDFQIEIIVIGHTEEDRPVGEGLPVFSFIVQPKKGCANSVWYGANICFGKWFVWLCDDHKYPQRDWLYQAHLTRLQNPGVKVIRFNSKSPNKNCAQIGMGEKDWYLKHYPEPVYEHYGWDDEIAAFARKENVYYDAKNVIIEDCMDEHRINWEIKKRDGERNSTRLKQFGLIG